MTALCCCVFFALLAACGTRPSPATQSAPAAAPAGPRRVELTAEAYANAEVETARVGEQRFAPRLALPATVEGDPRELARVGARVPGRVVALRASVGDRVQAGDPLVEVDSVELHQVTTEYLVANARDRQMADALQRARALNAERVGPLQDVRRAEADATASAAARHEAEEHLHFLGLRDADIRRLRGATSHGQAHSVVRAPIGGTVASLEVALGQVLAGSETVAVVGRTERVRVAVHVYERELARVSVGARVTLRTGADGSEQAAGELYFIGTVLDPQTRTADALVAVDNARGALRPGMALTAFVELAADPRALWLPPEAVQSVDGRPTVFVEVRARAFEARPVRVGDEQGGRVPVLEGLRTGETVALRGAFALRAELEKAELGGED